MMKHKNCFSIKYMFFLLQAKSALRLIPKLLFGTLVFSILTVLIGYIGSKTLYSQRPMLFFKIAAVLPENDPLVNAGFHMVSEMDSLKEYCEFISTDEEGALELLENGEVFGVVNIPEGFIADVLNGVNTPAKIIIPDNSGMESLLFRAVLNAGSNSLAFVQSGIYAVSDTYYYFGLTEETAQAAEDLNRAYILSTLNRNNLFEKVTVRTTGSLTLPQFYLCSGLLLLMFFSAMTFGSYVNQENKELILILSRSRISLPCIYLFKVLVLTLLYGTLFLLLLLFAKTGISLFWNADTAESLIFAFTPGRIAIFYLCTASIAAFIVFLFTLSGNGLYGILSVFFVNVLMAFASGYIIPAAYLPTGIRTLGKYLPSAAFHQTLGAFYMEGIPYKEAAACLIWCIVFLGAAALWKRHSEKEVFYVKK